MALLNNYYVFVKQEDLRRSVEVSTHPVEQGIDLTDHVKRFPAVLSLSGELVGEEAAAVREAIASLQAKGSLVNYIGATVLAQAQITSFDASHTNQIAGGCSFTMELTEVRFAQSPYQTGNRKTRSTTKAGMQQVEGGKTGKVYHTVKKGETAYSIGKKYASNGSGMAWIMKNNPNAPKKKGDWTTLQIGTKLWVYSR